MQRIDRWVGLGLTLLGAAAYTSGRSFPDVPGQKLGAAFLPMLVGAGLALCGALLMARSWRGGRPGEACGEGSAAAQSAATAERVGPPLAVMAAVVAYIALTPTLGFLIVSPLCLVALLRTMGVGWKAAVLWAVAGTLLVHVAFYKLLRVPLPWGVLRPFY